MSRSLSNSMVKAVYAQDVDQAFLVLLTISHASLGEPIRVLNDGRNIERIESHSRASIATYRHFDGEMTIAEIDELRPNILSDLKQNGSLVEEESTNLAFPASDIEFNNNWDTSTGLNYTNNAVLSPDGTMSGTELEGYGINLPARIRYTNIAEMEFTDYSSSFFVKLRPNNTITKITVAFFNGIDGMNSYIDFHFNIVDDIIYAPSQEHGKVEYWADGWARISIKSTIAMHDPSEPGTLKIQIENSAGPFLTQDDGIYFWGAQIEVGDLTSFIPTTTEAVTRSADVVTKETYAAFPFEISIADDRDGAPGNARLSIDNVDQIISDSLNELSGAPLVKMEIVRSGWFDVTEVEFPTYSLNNVKDYVNFVEGDLVLTDLTAEPFPADTFTPGAFRGVF